MKQVKIYGSSDDLIEIEGDLKGADEYNQENGVFDCAGLRIGVGYTPWGTWGIAVAPIDEDITPKAENIRLTVHERGYSMQLDMEVPDDAYIVLVQEAMPGA